eukprot:NODE_7030_length_818_cov_39.800000_g6427_i0.p1 GENE.NODE_7030_length_818_cov_39.800000_g6427_i0~~NODE_7030_length_818_cov_39.800000_g6427_i0.p1  ORF type:complete len:259 (-),score=57.85 NODE_7030_length_818_cov_39.800000_g6427_i0:42-758(-)
MLVFGGLDKEYNYRNDVWIFNILDKTWKQQICNGNLPKPRYRHSCSVSDDKDAIYIFGGMGGDTFNDIYKLDLNKMVWTELITQGDIPCIRFNSVMCYWNYNLYIYGGAHFGENSEHISFDDLYLFNISKLTWTRILPEGDAPPQKNGHCCVKSNKSNSIWIMGGSSFTHFTNDLYELTQLDQQHAWKVYKCDGEIPNRRYMGSMSIYNDELLMFIGGQKRHAGEEDLLELIIPICGL